MIKSEVMSECDSLFSLRIRERDGICMWCGANEQIDAHHIVSRTYKALRYKPLNAISLCRECHQKAHNSRYLFTQFLSDKFPAIKRFTTEHKYDKVVADIPFYKSVLRSLKTAQFEPLIDDAILNL